MFFGCKQHHIDSFLPNWGACKNLPRSVVLLTISSTQGDDKVVDDMYIPGGKQQYLRRDYRIIKNTVEGEEPMWHKQLAVKKVARSQAEKVVVDLIVSRSKDDISRLYNKLT